MPVASVVKDNDEEFKSMSSMCFKLVKIFS